MLDSLYRQTVVVAGGRGGGGAGVGGRGQGYFLFRA